MTIKAFMKMAAGLQAHRDAMFPDIVGLHLAASVAAERAVMSRKSERAEAMSEESIPEAEMIRRLEGVVEARRRGLATAEKLVGDLRGIYGMPAAPDAPQDAMQQMLATEKARMVDEDAARWAALNTAASTGGPGRTWDGERHGPPAGAVPEPLTGEPSPEEWGEAMRTVLERFPEAGPISLDWNGREFVACSRKGIPGAGLFAIPRRRARHPRG